MIVFVLLLTFYVVGLLQGLQVIHDVETDAAIRVWGSFLGLLEEPISLIDDLNNDDDDDMEGVNLR